MRTPPSRSNPALRGLRLPDDVQAPTLWYRGMRRAAQMGSVLLWKIRVFGRRHEPAHGGALYISNHQSFLDPVLMALALRRPMNYMGRQSLFRYPLLRSLMESLNAFPIRRGTADVAALKEAMRRLRAGAQLVVFAEGTRTRDGRIGPFLPGVALLAQRAARATVPVVIDGAFEAWPRTRAIFRPGRIVVQYGRPISQARARRIDSQAFVNEIRRRIIAMQAEVRRRTGRPPLIYDADEAPPARKG